MKTVLVVYGTTEGQTRKVAEFIANALQERGAKVELLDSASASAAQVQPFFAAAVVCGSLHRHRYQASLLRFVKDNAAWLAGIPSAFIAVSLTAVLADDESREERGDETGDHRALDLGLGKPRAVDEAAAVAALRDGAALFEPGEERRDGGVGQAALGGEVGDDLGGGRFAAPPEHSHHRQLQLGELGLARSFRHAVSILRGATTNVVRQL